MYEVALESAPQLATQWAAVMAQQSQGDRSNFSVGALQQLSITTSTLAIVFSIVSYVTRNRRTRWICPGFPPTASLLPMGCFTLTAVLSGTISFRLLSETDVVVGKFRLFITSIDLEFIAIITNAFSMVINIFFILMSGSCACCNRVSFKIIRATTHMCLSGLLPAFLFYNLATDYSKVLERYRRWNIFTTFVISLLCQILHFLLGIIIFSGLNYARLFSPIVLALVTLIRSIADCCHRERRYHINAMLDDLLKPETENQIVVSEQPRGRKRSEPNQVTMRPDYVTELSEFRTECV